MNYTEEKVKGSIINILALQCFIKENIVHFWGDYTLEFLGLKPWSNNYTGVHLSLIYFGCIALISIVTGYKIKFQCDVHNQIFYKLKLSGGITDSN